MTVDTKCRHRSRSPNEIDKRFGVKLRELRVERGMTLQALAEAIGVSHQQLQKYETGSNRLSVGMLPVVADALGVEMVELLNVTAPAVSVKMTKADRLREEAMAVLRRTRSECTLRAMARVLKALAAPMNEPRSPTDVESPLTTSHRSTSTSTMQKQV